MIIIYYTPCHGCPHFEKCHKIPHDEEGEEEKVPTFPEEDLPEVDIKIPPSTPGRKEEERPRLSP